MSIGAELQNRIHFYPIPEGFDPLTATARQLDEFRLPERPSEDQREALEYWKELFSAPTKFVRPEFEIDGPHDIGPITTMMRGSASNERRFERSRNWSGAVVKSRLPDRFTSVRAAWTVPSVSIPGIAPIDPSPGVPGRDWYKSSIWVGINGYRSYPRMTMPQIGTWQRIKADGKTYDFAAWWQWWSRDEVTPIVKITNLEVQAGDRILAGLLVVSADEVVFYIKNQTRGLFSSMLVQGPPKSEPLGMTAEWIVERPTTPGFLWPWRLPKFTDIEFDHCHAFAGPSPVGITTPRDLGGAGFLRMQERFPQPYRSAFIAIAKRTSRSRLRVRHMEG